MSNLIAKVAKPMTLFTLLLCLPLLLLIPACSSSSSIASVDDMTLGYSPFEGGLIIQVLLKPNNVTANSDYQVVLYEGNLLVGSEFVSWSEAEITAQRDAEVIFPIRKLSPQVESGSAKLTSVYHVKINKIE